MDMFYAAVEMRDQPSLRDKPMAVGSNAMLVGRNNKFKTGTLKLVRFGKICECSNILRHAMVCI